MAKSVVYEQAGEVGRAKKGHKIMLKDGNRWHVPVGDVEGVAKKAGYTLPAETKGEKTKKTVDEKFLGKCKRAVKLLSEISVNPIGLTEEAQTTAKEIVVGFFLQWESLDAILASIEDEKKTQREQEIERLKERLSTLQSLNK